MRSTSLFKGGFAALVVGALSSPTWATVLTFDFGGFDGQTIPQSYGDRVGGMFPPPGTYGAAGGITPHVQVQYAFNSGNVKLGGNNPARTFGDLVNVAYIHRDANPPGILEITLVADPGWLVCLSSFDLASAYNATTGAGENLPARSIQVRDNTTMAVYQVDFSPAHTDPLNDPLSTYTPGFGSPAPFPTHRTFTFNPPIQSDTITIWLDFSQLVTIGGNKSDRIGIDNVLFSEKPVPTPGAAGLLVVSGLMIFSRRRR